MPAQGSTTARGYGSSHQKLRDALIADLKARPGQLCPRCSFPMYADQALDLGHTDDRTGYNGLEHARCNRRAGARKANRTRRGRRQWKQTPLQSRW